MKYFISLIFSIFLTLPLASFKNLNNENPYTQLATFSEKGGEFEDVIHVYIVEFRQSFDVKAKVTYNKSTNQIILDFKGADGSMHQEVMEGIHVEKNNDTPSVVTFDDNNMNDEIYVSVTEYSGKLSVIWNGEFYHMM
ncbi:hypothetical protein [Flammeovirga pacifica]|uniref:Uncharacterized protein n=1 Tax=Flammeovirga pacifica TaxID=915059 RepID=A0A1S1Z525_FLAPC|nr:hypothetical protein [Flammeovirga pacifica]OHX68317.1 hypothetical protein NH26_19175 [Flammeovirga pacifica]